MTNTKSELHNQGKKTNVDGFFYSIQYTDNFFNDDKSSSTPPFLEKLYNKSLEATVNVFDVASYILSKTGSITSMRLQKLVYYSMVWSLVWDEKPLFSDKIEAWANGPVVPRLYSFHRGEYLIDSCVLGNPDLLSTDSKETIDAVLEFYKDTPTQSIIDQTHNEKPWIKARVGLSPGERGTREISIVDIAEYYSSLI